MPDTARKDTPRQIVVMRHAKAEQHGTSDFDRHLADRGVEEGALAGRWLVAQGFVPDHVLVSAALRTRETWAAVADGAGWDADTIETDENETLYEAGPETALDLVREVPEEVRAHTVRTTLERMFPVPAPWERVELSADSGRRGPTATPHATAS